MPALSLMIWILVAPLLIAVVDLVRTLSSLRREPPGVPGAWSRALHVNGR